MKKKFFSKRKERERRKHEDWGRSIVRVLRKNLEGKGAWWVKSMMGCKHERLGAEKARTYHAPLKTLSESITCKTKNTAILSDLSLSFSLLLSPSSAPMALCPVLAFLPSVASPNVPRFHFTPWVHCLFANPEVQDMECLASDEKMGRHLSVHSFICLKKMKTFFFF